MRVVRVEVIHPRDLQPPQISAWRAFQGADPALASPYLTPEWAQIVGAARTGARICVLDGGRGFLPVQRLSRFSAMGLGAPIADYQGVVGAPDLRLDAHDICRALEVGRIDLAHVPAGQAILRGAEAGQDGSWIVDVSTGAAEYRAGLKARRAEFVRQLDKKHRKLARDHGEPVFTALSLERGHFDTMLGWKLAQLARTGQPGIWATPWVRQVLEACFAAQGAHFSGAFFTLTVGDRLVGANFCLRGDGVLHDWVMAHDSAFDAYSPGVLLARLMIEWAAVSGLREVDFGPGDYQYKRQLATGQRALAWGCAGGLSWSGLVRRAQFALRSGMERLPARRVAALPGKAMRRLDLMRGLGAADRDLAHGLH